MILLRCDSAKEDRATAVVRAPAKLNLCLDILGRREDGFHDLSTIMVPIGLHDTVTVTRLPPAAAEKGTQAEPIERASSASTEPDQQSPSDQVNLCSGVEFEPSTRAGPILLEVRFPSGTPCVGDKRSIRGVPTDADNLAHRAVRRLHDVGGVSSGAHIQLVKRIPTEAGLGGGSSDAAAALIGANAVWGLGWNRSQLLEVAAEVGSDVPFFLAGRTALCGGRGERVSPVHHASRLSIVIAQPAQRLSTASVFREYDNDKQTSTVANRVATQQGIAGQATGRCGPIAARERAASIVAALQKGRLAQLGRLLFNQLERSARRLADSIDSLHAAFTRLDVVGHSMTGSGSASFAICRNDRHARCVAAALRARFPYWVCATHSCP